MSKKKKNANVNVRISEQMSNVKLLKGSMSNVEILKSSMSNVKNVKNTSDHDHLKHITRFILTFSLPTHTTVADPN